MKPENLDDENLWVDPLRNDPRLKSGAVLLAEVIKDYVYNYNLLIQKDDFDPRNLKGASYAMTPHPSDAWTIEPDSTGKGEDLQVQLTKRSESRGDFYLVSKNSLVYIRLREQLRIPFYIIGRHNLKIRYVYKGLLLGTGPQVDPGYIGNLIIPLHNLTTKDVKVFINESFASIDFVRTTPFFSSKEIVPSTYDDLYRQYKKPKHLIDTRKVIERISLSDYLENSTPRSQMAEFQRNIDGWEAALNEAKKKQQVQTTDLTQLGNDIRRWSKIEYIIIAAVLISLLSCFGALVYHFDKKFSEVEEVAAANLIAAEKTLISTNAAVQALSNRLFYVSQEQISAASNISVLNAEIKRLAAEVSRLSKSSGAAPAATGKP